MGPRRPPNLTRGQLPPPSNGDCVPTAATCAAAGALALAVVTTGLVNVPVNLTFGWWDAAAPPDDWREARRRWERFQGIRSWLLLASFVLLSTAVTLRS